MKNKKAWLRIIEAFLAVLILLSAVLIILSRQGSTADFSNEITATQNKILEIVSKNYTLRGYVIEDSVDSKAKIDKAISEMLPQNLNFATKICEINEACGSNEIPANKEVYARETIITSTITSTLVTYNPKKLRLFVWMK